MIRMSSRNVLESGLAQLQQRQQELARAQEQMSSGKRVLRPSDDPVAAARAERAAATQVRTQADARALDAARHVTSMAEAALGAGGDILQRVRELVVAAGNGSYSDAERLSLAEEIQGLRADLLSVANRADGVGGYLFGGQGSRRPPFLDEPAGVTFDGAAGQSRGAGEEPLPMAMDGRAIWLQAPNAIDGAPDQSVFDVLDRVASELATPGRDDPAIAQTVSDGLRDLDGSMNHLGAYRARAGQALNHIDSVEVRLSQQALAASYERSAAEDLDMVEAISDFQNKQTGYDAALKAYSMVQRLSLFQYIGS